LNRGDTFRSIREISTAISTIEGAQAISASVDGSARKGASDWGSGRGRRVQRENENGECNRRSSAHDLKWPHSSPPHRDQDAAYLSDDVILKPLRPPFTGAIEACTEICGSC
jgi:hypothetical protein